ncbi:MAG: sigma-70 family RNA polymerase sigma factor [Thermoanaerobaculia bacterium]|nr:sigma-70 family RNA polymerase sigma factor [Thermoanaerobaculia bacterium]
MVVRTLDGSQAAFGELVRRYERPIVGLILRMVRDRGVAEELAQDVFVKAYDRLETYDQRRKFSSWLFKVAHNATIDHLRRRRLDTVPLETGESDDLQLTDVLAATGSRKPDDRVLQREIGEALEAAIGELRPAYREVLLLRFAHGASYDEIAEVMDLPLGTVKTHLHRARKQLAERLEERGWAP